MAKCTQSRHTVKGLLVEKISTYITDKYRAEHRGGFALQLLCQVAVEEKYATIFDSVTWKIFSFKFLISGFICS